MKRRGFLKFIGMAAAAPVVAPLVAMCKPKERVNVCLPSMDVLVYDQSKLKLRPHGVDMNESFYGRGRHGMPETWEWSNSPFDGEQS